MIINKTYNTQDLVLGIRTSYNPESLNLKEWERYITVLCGDREYQKDAIRRSIIYLASGIYNSIEDLVTENCKSNHNLLSRYHTLEDYKKKIQLPSRLSGTIDLATGTGKSYVMYGIAQIALGLGFIDRVLLLCPSVTIREELIKKFSELSTDKRLIDAIPVGANFKNPAVINASQTIIPGTICICNIHSIYSANSSSILTSLGFGIGNKCLVLNDESHHVYNKVEGKDDETQSLKKWKEFLLNAACSFKYILGFSGTTYIDNEYFNDVIYRFSLRKAIEQGFVKKIDYVQEDDSANENEKFQKIYKNHLDNKDKYSLVKPLTILITKDIKEAKQLNSRLVEFLVSKKEGDENYVGNRKVLVVTSHSDHKLNLIKLKNVDSDDDVEWIISVAMLTEGWDVKNVFQIVPMEEKAFNSKLLISQVLGRGLRLPMEYNNARVTVFNHSKWSSKIQELVNEILEIEERLRNSIIKSGERAKFNFELYNINYEKTSLLVENTKTNNDSQVFNYKGYIDLISESFSHESETTYVSIDGEQIPVNYIVEREKFDVNDIANKIILDFETRDWEGKTLRLQESEYTVNNLPPRSEILQYIRRSMERVGINGDYVGKSNRTAIYSTFNTLLRQSNVSKVYSKVAENLVSISTSDREHESISALSLRQNSTVYYTDQYLSEIVLEDTLTVFNEVLEDGTLPRKAVSSPKNNFTFKTPSDLVFVSHDPERKFVDLLTKDENSQKITSWIKSTSQNFYSIEFTIQLGTHSVQKNFNPDFFIKVLNNEVEYFFVIETKADDDDSDENKAKFKYGKQHFVDLNKQLAEQMIKQEYRFHFLSPNDFVTFFEYLRDDRLINNEFQTSLERLLKNDV